MKGKAVIKKKLKSKKKYYFKIRTLKSVNGRIYYSDYSKSKKLKDRGTYEKELCLLDEVKRERLLYLRR